MQCIFSENHDNVVNDTGNYKGLTCDNSSWNRGGQDDNELSIRPGRSYTRKRYESQLFIVGTAERGFLTYGYRAYASRNSRSLWTGETGSGTIVQLVVPVCAGLTGIHSIRRVEVARLAKS